MVNILYIVHTSLLIVLLYILVPDNLFNIKYELNARYNV